ncbi:MAG: DUF4160 domain-containing protein [Chloracidobacterium sp.]|nr:DUF4160 domain-containing protein [Chloracidobacterium sp.]
MPLISRFFGILIYMYFDDHAPPHFHAEYGEYEELIEIMTLNVYRGQLPRRVHNMVLEWADLHRQELMENWLAARKNQELKGIAPLE